MKTIQTTHRRLLHLTSRARSPKGWVWVPSARRCSEINFHFQDRLIFRMFDPGYPLSFRIEGQKWVSLLEWMLNTTPQHWKTPTAPTSVKRMQGT